MNTSTKDILNEILQITLKIKNNYPELYANLDENPETIPNEANPDISDKELLSHLHFLKEELSVFIKKNYA